MGLPMVGLVHVGMGSFLSMQAYFGATFIDGIGPVTGVGLVRNLAPLLTGFILTGLISARYVAELGGDPGPEEAEIEPARRVAARLVAAMIAGPILAVWGAFVGIAIGWLVAHNMMGLTVPANDLVPGDALGPRPRRAAGEMRHLRLRRRAPGLPGGAVEAVGPERPADLEPIGSSACRAACLAGVAILFVNSAWFLLFYHAGAAFGPTVLTPPRS